MGSYLKTNSVNLFGILWDNDLKWDRHIEKVKSKMNSGTYILKRFKRMLPLSCLKIIYESLIKWHYIYGLAIFGNSSNIGGLIKKQKYAIRSISGKQHSEPILKSLGILKLEDEYKIQLEKYSLEIFWNKAPKTLKYDFTWRNGTSYNTRTTKNVRETKWKSTTLARQ